MADRTFVDIEARRENTPLLLGLVGPSGSGKTYSALRLATGIQKVAGGDIFMIDTEARRGLHYAEKFKFRHIDFSAPFSPLDYLAAIEHCVKKGAKTIVIDQCSSEHDGVGGVLEEHDREVVRLTQIFKSAQAAQIPAWGVPKGKRRKLINSMLQMQCNFLLLFRAKDKIKIKKRSALKPGEEQIQQLGFMPIAGEEFIYECTLNCLLLPGCGGVPTWHPEEMGEKLVVKLPEQFKEMFKDKPILSEEIGEKLAKWAAGGVAAVVPARATEKMPEPITEPPAEEAILVKQVTEKPAKVNGKDAVAYAIMSEDGRTFHTLEGVLGDRAKVAQEIEQPVLVTYTMNANGSLVLSDIRPAPEA